MLDHDTLLARVRKLLAKAEDPAVTEAEAESYNNKAAQLIARYGIDRAMLAAADAGTDEITTIKISMDNPYSRDKAGLLTNIAHPLRCRALLHRWGQNVTAVTVFGFRSDLERVELREELRPALEELSERDRQILVLRFVAGKTQTEIAAIIGVSQMQISRLISRSLDQLRERLSDDAEPAV